jgi:hypothetical protein
LECLQVEEPGFSPQGLRVLWPPHLLAYGQNLLVQLLGFLIAALLLKHPADSVPGGQRVRMGFASHPFADLKNLPK